MSDGRNGAPVPYTAYKSKRAQQVQPQVSPGIVNPSPKPTSRPTSFIGGVDVWDKAQNVLGGIVKGAEDMGQGLMNGITPDRPNSVDAPPSFGKVHTAPPISSPHQTSRPSSPRQHKQQTNGHELPLSSSPPVPRTISVSLPTSPAHGNSPTSLHPPQLIIQNGQPNMDQESPRNSNSETSVDGEVPNSSHESSSASTESSTSGTVSPMSSPGAGSSKLQLPPSPTRSQPRKSSSFRYVPRSSPLNPHAIPHSRTPSTSSVQPIPSSPGPPTPSKKLTHELHLPSTLSESVPANRVPSFPISASPASSPQSVPQDPPKRTDSLKLFSPASNTTSSPYIRDISPSPAPSHKIQSSQNTSPSTGPSRVTSPHLEATRNGAPTPERVIKSAPSLGRTPYRPGFQPKGVYRPRTDEFTSLRRQFRDGSNVADTAAPDCWSTPLSRIERTKLERRLEKIIHLRFPLPSERPIPKERRRHSSFFGSLSVPLLASTSSADIIPTEGRELTKAEIRTAEQRITAWEEDSQVKACWVCQTTFHPLTNRKHHCRLCGHIVCALPVSLKMTTSETTSQPHPLRPVKCSYLFVVDTDTMGKRTIEEVGEGVDYGVKRHRVTSSGSHAVMQDFDDDRFLRGVRICRACRPVLLRTQYAMEMVNPNTETDISRLYEVMISLEKEIEDRLPAFHGLVNSSNTLEPDAVSSPQIATMRKHLLESFTSYDNVAKRIAALPHGGKQNAPDKGKNNPSGQERIQTAILMRARIFLEKNMFPLKKTLASAATTSKSASHAKTPASDKDKDKDHRASLTAQEKQVYATLQPFLLQELSIETYIEQAQASRKFEDVRTLRQNLTEIRAEIDRVVKVEGLDVGRKSKGTKK